MEGIERGDRGSVARGPEVRPSRRKNVAAVVLTAMLVLAAGACNIGWEGPSYEGASGAPSGSKPESKVWFHDGLWWSSLFDTVSGDHHIFRLDVPAKRWVDTGVALDPRENSRADVLWDGTHLYVASHVFRDGSPTSGYPSRLYRLRYENGTWVKDPGFPQNINNLRTETLVLDRDVTGKLWATWVQDNQVFVTSTTNGDQDWAPASAVPGATGLNSDDISSLVSFSSPTGPRIGVMWSNQNVEKMFFSSRLDLTPVATWTAPEVAYEGDRAADDHINLKSVQDVGGRLLAAVKTSKSGSGSALVVLLDRSTTGVWTNHTFGTVADAHTRPIVAIDAEAQVVHMFATAGQSGGSIYEKTAPLSNISFAPGRGKEVLRDDNPYDINNATTTKQLVSSTTGLVVLATNDTSRQYWTHYDSLASPPPPTTTTTTTTTSTTSTTTTTAPPAR